MSDITGDPGRSGYGRKHHRKIKRRREHAPGTSGKRAPATAPTYSEKTAPAPRKVKRSGTTPAGAGKAPTTRVPRAKRERQVRNAAETRQRVKRVNKRIKREEAQQRRLTNRQLRYHFSRGRSQAFTDLDRLIADAYKAGPEFNRRLAKTRAERERREDPDTKILGVNVEAEAEGRGALAKAAKWAKRQVEKNSRGGTYSSQGVPTQLPKEAIDLAANLPSGVYLTGAAAKEAAQGDSKRANEMLRQFKETSAAYALVTGKPGEALKRAGKAPLATTLEFSGAGALGGRVAGAGARAGGGGRRLKRYARNLDRPASGHRAYARSGVEGPKTSRRYSRNLARMAAQKRADKRRAEQPAKPQRREAQDIQRRARHMREHVPGTPSLRRRVDTRRFAQARRLREREAEARGRARKIGKPGRGKLRGRRAEQDARAIVTQLAAEWTLRNPKKVRAELERALRDVDAAEPKARKRGPREHELNRGEATRIAAALRLNDNQLRQLMSEARHVEAEEAPRQARLEHEGLITAKQRSARWKPFLQSLRPDLEGAELNVAARALERRARRGKSLPEGPTAKGPVLISQRDQGVAAPIGLEPQRFPTGKRSGKAYKRRARPTGTEAIENQFAMSERAAASAESRNANLREFGIPAGSKGRVFAESKGEANRRAQAMEAKTGEQYTPVMIAAPNVTGPRLRQLQERTDPTGTTARGAKAESGKGRWLLVPKEAASRFSAHDAVSRGEQVQGIRQFRGATGTFKDVVLTTVNPSSWLTSNITDLAMRGILGGHTPMDLKRGRAVTEMLRKSDDPQAQEAFSALTGGGLYGAAEALVTRGKRVGPLSPFRGYRDFIYKFEHGLERALQDAVVGKAMRQRTSRKPTRQDRVMADRIKALGKLHGRQVENFAKRVGTDRTLESELQYLTEDVIGRWGKVSPAMRAGLSIAPFAQWLGAATRYVYLTLPTKHPIKTGIMAGIMQMTQEERERLGLSTFAPRGKQAQDYQFGMLPIDVGSNKYGPTVEGVRTSHMTSFGTAGGFPGNWRRFVLPQVDGALTAAFGNSWTGDRLVYPPWWPNEDERGHELSPTDRAKVGLGLLIESSVPFASTVRRNVMEKGESSYPTSTILAPESRRERVGKGNKYKLAKREGGTLGAVADWVDPIARGRTLTHEAEKAMQENEATFGPGGTMDRIQRGRKRKRRRSPGAGGTDRSTF